MDTTEKNLIHKLQFLAEQFKNNKGREGNYTLQINQQESGCMDFTIRAGNDQLYTSGNYKLDYSRVKNKTSCHYDQCEKIIEYGLISEDSAFSNKVRVQEKYTNNSDHFDIKLTFCDKDDHTLGKYQAELSFQYSKDQEHYEYFIIHDVIAL